MKEIKISEMLHKGESILWEGSAKENDYLTIKSVNIFPIILLWLAAECVLLGVAVMNKILGKDFNIYYLILVIVSVLLHIIPTVIWFMGISRENARIRGDEYAITNERLIINHTRLHECYESISVKDIEEMYLRRSLAEHIFGTGRIVIKTEEEDIILYSLDNADKVFKKAYRAVFKNRDEDNE